LPLNAVLAWALSGGHLGFAQMGAAGAALATLVAAALGALGMAVAVWTLPQARARGVRAVVGTDVARLMQGVIRLFVFGGMPAMAAALEIAGFALVIGLSTRLGDAVAHAYQIVFSIHNVTFAVAIGFGSAAGVRAGNAVGEGEAGAATMRVAVALALALATTGMLVLALIVARLLIVAAFPATDEVHQLAAAMLTLWAPFILFDSTQMVLASALRSLGDQVIAGINSIIAFFGVTGGAGWLLVHWGYGATGLVMASAAGMVAAAALHGARFWQVSARSRLKS
ncbi:MAG: MATE family efflux transporter, partial [Sphingomonas sp.]